MMTVLRTVTSMPRIFREARQRLDQLSLEQEVIREVSWQLDRLDDMESEERCMVYLQSFRQQRRDSRITDLTPCNEG